jgi:hypothetical protein
VISAAGRISPQIEGLRNRNGKKADKKPYRNFDLQKMGNWGNKKARELGGFCKCPFTASFRQFSITYLSCRDFRQAPFLFFLYIRQPVGYPRNASLLALKAKSFFDSGKRFP